MVGMQTLAYNQHSHSSKYKGRNKLSKLETIERHLQTKEYRWSNKSEH
jgi:hypothetical protein